MSEDRIDLALRIVQLIQANLVANNHFLAAALGALDVQMHQQKTCFATNGQQLFVDPNQLIELFSRTGELPLHDYMHVVAHCLFLHPLIGKRIHSHAWNLACDIIAEMISSDIVGTRPGERGEKIDELLSLLMRQTNAQLTAERLYHHFTQAPQVSDTSTTDTAPSALHEAYVKQHEQWEALCFVDDHELWYDALRTQQDAASKQKQPQVQQAKQPQQKQNDDSASQEASKQQAASNLTKEADDADADDADQQKPTLSGVPSELTLTEAQMKRAEKNWSNIARNMRVDLETLSRQRGSKLRELIHQLEVSQHEQLDYREFLRQFASYQEEMHLSDDEFDYVFYTYGLSLYDDMPLIEPLEYTNKNKIRDFVIVIDTSSSVTGKIVQSFVDATYDVLSSTESFFQKINIHIIQCDLEVRSDTKITSLGDMNQWRKKIKLSGFGGTDFRPAFRYIQKLRQAGEFDDLAGVIYFTDGWGIYPESMPPYKVAFVFYDEDHRPDLVPAWAIQLTINSGQCESMSVY